MSVENICPLCGGKMFHDKGNHITFCGSCDHVGWPHDAQGVKASQNTDKSQKETNNNDGNKAK